eukprot:8728223-Ditylum_brightwellii.AAC.1
MSPSGEIVPQMDCIQKSKGPQICVNFIRPMEMGMDDHGTSPLHDDLDVMSGNAVLVMSTNPTHKI